MLTYIWVSFWFFPPKRVRVSFLIGLVLGLVFVLGLGLGFRFEFGFGKLIGGAIGHKTLLLCIVKPIYFEDIN